MTEHFDWTRFWLPESAPELSLLDDGFIPDSEGTFGRAHNPEIREFAEIAETRFLLLIGEPGIGKSFALREAYESTKDSLTQGDDALFVDMGRTEVEDRLRSKIFESPEFERWKAGSHELHLFLDSLDEANASITKLKSLILEGLDEGEINRLKLRITCRTAERLDGLEEELLARFSPDESATYELLPLRRKDILLAAGAGGLDKNSFVGEVIQRGLQPFASSPKDLNMLIALFQASGEFPGSNVELYERCCVLDCEEGRDEAAKAATNSGVLLAVASRVAAALTLSGRRTIIRGARAGSDPATTADDLITLDERRGDPPERLQQVSDLIAEALESGLFASHGPGKLGVKHSGVAEFLTARHLAKSQLDLPALVRLLMQQSQNRFLPTPQLSEVIKWLAQMNQGFKEFILSECPTALLGGDLRYLTDHERSTVIAAVFDAVERQETELRDRPFRRRLASLGHEGIRDQVSGVLADRSLRDETRETAIDLVRECNLAELGDDCVRIALDESESVHVRVVAVYAIGDIGSEDARSQVAPLAIEPPDDDEHDELKGAALRAAFPSAIDISTLFSILTDPKDSSYFGAYNGFLSRSIIPNLKDGDLDIAADWILSLDPELEPRAALEQLRDAVFVRCVDAPDGSPVWPKLAAYAKRRLNEYHDLVETRSVLPSDGLKTEGRHRLVEVLLPAIESGDLNSSRIHFSTPALVSYDDADWALKQLAQAVGTPTETAWATVASETLHPNVNPDQMMAACEMSDKFIELSTGLLAGVELGSGIDEQLRSRYYGEDEDAEEAAEDTEFGVNADSREIVEGWLDAIENEDLAALWRFSTQLDRTFPTEGWMDGEGGLNRLFANVDDAQKARLLGVAKKYLLEADASNEEWLGQGVFHNPSIAAYRCIQLIKRVDPEWFANEGVSALPRWAHVIVWWPLHAEDDSAEKHLQLVKELFQVRPDVVVEAFTEHVDATLTNQSQGELPSMATVRAVGIEEFEPGLINAFVNGGGTQAQRSNLLDFAIAQGSNDAIDIARGLVGMGPDSETESEERLMALRAAKSLIHNDSPTSWPVIADAAHRNVELGKSIAHEIANARDSAFWAQLSESQIGALYQWMEEQFPREDDPPYTSGWGSTHREVPTLRDAVLRGLTLKGTSAAVDEIERLEAALPKVDFLPRLRFEAERERLSAEWSPPAPDEVVELVSDASRRFVRSQADLQEVVLRSLERLQARIDSTSESDLYWNTSPKIIPKHEGEISERLKLWLDDDLVERGIVVNREVTVRTMPSGKDGERVDIKIDAATENGEIVTLIVEVKGCWNADIPGSIDTQLFQKYLGPTGSEYGIYLVAHFASDRWNNEWRKDTKYSKASAGALFEDLRDETERVNALRTVMMVPVVLEIVLHVDPSRRRFDFKRLLKFRFRRDA